MYLQLISELDHTFFFINFTGCVDWFESTVSLDAGTRDCVDCDNDIRGLGGVDF